jgi:hypothetical protein
VALKKKGKIQLTEGSTYKITSIGTRDNPTKTSGVFKGYTVVGNMDAICMELDKSHRGLKGKLRIIPTHMVMTIDIVTAKRPKKDDKDAEEAVFYR